MSNMVGAMVGAAWGLSAEGAGRGVYETDRVLLASSLGSGTGVRLRSSLRTAATCCWRLDMDGAGFQASLVSCDWR